MNIIELRGINKIYGTGGSKVHVLRDIDLDIESGDFVAIIGQSGSGKSTLMNIIGCLDTSTSGDYKIAGEDIEGMSPDDLATLRSRYIGFIFQRYNLLTSLSAQENVELPAIYSGEKQDVRKARAAQLLADLDMGERVTHLPSELSGGQQQRVSIARALMNGGNIILADEPTGALDSKSGENVMEILQQLNDAGHTVILVTHDQKIAATANRVIEIKDGRIIGDERLRPNKNSAKIYELKKDLRSTFAYLKDQFVEAFKMSIQAIRAHKMRSMLTMLGIIIGIASVVSVVALGKGSQEKILSDINAMGTNTVVIMPGKGFGDRNSSKYKTLTVHDSELLARQSYVASSTPAVSSSGNITRENISVTGQLQGVGEQYFDVKGLKAEAGRLLTKDDIIKGNAVVVIDQNTKNKLFAHEHNSAILGQTVIFNRHPLRIVGISEKQNASYGAQDTLQMWAPYTAVMNRITGDRNISSITVKIVDDVSMTAAEKNIIRFLTVKHGKEDFFTINTDSIRQTVESTTGTMRLLISCIALISLVVGGIGVMNIMLVSVTERTREIGIRMAVGARRSSVLQQFLIEAVLICIIGGFLGILFAFGIGLLFSMFVKMFTMSYSAASVILALFCSTMIGIIFGYIPAKNAAKLNPVDALSSD